MAVKFTKRLIFLFEINDIEFTPIFVVTIALDRLVRYRCMKVIKTSMISSDYHSLSTWLYIPKIFLTP